MLEKAIIKGSLIFLLDSLISKIVVQDMNGKVVYYCYRFHARDKCPLDLNVAASIIVPILIQ
jgi:hypothetical protein